MPKSAWDTQLELVTTALEQMLQEHRDRHGANPVDSQRWLEVLHRHYGDRMLADNERIWRTGALAIPLSLAAFAAVPSIHCLAPWHVIALSVPSVTLMLVWLAISENHRAFQTHSQIWLVAIERAMGLRAPVATKVASDGPESRLVRRGSVQRLRWTLVCMVVALWVAIIAGSSLGWLPSQCEHQTVMPQQSRNHDV
jgi:hypothetical protein